MLRRAIEENSLNLQKIRYPDLKVYFGLDQLPYFTEGVLTIGTFDGLHHGHRTIIKQVIKKAKEVNGESILMTFDPHPRKIVFPNDNSLKLLTTLTEKIKLLTETGLDNLVIVPFDIAFSQISPSQYVEQIIIESIMAKHVIIGYDHRFGLNRAGNFDFLKEYESKGLFSLIEIPEQQINDIKVSSSKIRNNLNRGNIQEANQQLSHPYIFTGQIKHGLKLASGLGYPTANINISQSDKLIPKHGTYAAECLLNGKVYNGMVYIGKSKTLHTSDRLSIEMNIFHQFDHEFYEEELEIRLLEYIRSDEKYASKEELLFNIDQDKIACENFFNLRDSQSLCTIAVLNYNGRKHIETYLPSLENSSSSSTDLLVIDNASTDNSLNYLRESHLDISLIELRENHGFAGGYNEGLTELSSKYVALVNSDLRGTDNWLDPIIELMENEPNVGAVQPKVLSDTTPDQFEYAGASGGFIDAYGFPFCRGRLFDQVEADHNQYDSIEEVFWTTGAAMVIRTDLFKSLGGFDASFFAHMEEIDLCWRIKGLGYKLKVVPQSTVYHLGGGTLDYSSPNKTFLNFRNNWLILLGNLESSQLIKVILVRMILDNVYIMKHILSGKLNHAMAIIKAHISVLKRIRATSAKRRINSYHKNRSGKKSNMTGMYSLLLPWRYFVLGQKKFSELSKR